MDEWAMEEEDPQQTWAGAPAELAVVIPEPRGIGMADDDVLENRDVFWDWRLQMNTLLARIFDYLYPRGHLGIDADDWEEL